MKLIRKTNKVKKSHLFSAGMYSSIWKRFPHKVKSQIIFNVLVNSHSLL